jgi:hypothetical protein
MIPKHIQEKIDIRSYLWDSERFPFEQGALYGYTLAMEEIKPILDAAREVVNDDFIRMDSVLKLSQLIKQYDEKQNETT